MRKLFALVATMAMVLSMFAGVAFAAAGDTMILNTTAVTSSGSALGLQTVSGTVIDGTTGALYPTGIDVVVTTAGGTVLDTRTFANGSFTVYVPTNLAAQNLTVTATTTAGAALSTATLPVKYSVELTNSLEYTYSADQIPTTVSGIVKDSTGKVVSGAVVTLTLTDNAGVVSTLLTATTDSNGWFGNYVTYAKAGTLKLNVNGVQHTTGKVASLGFTLAVTPNTNVAHTVAPTNFTYEVTGGPASGTVVIEIFDSSDVKIHTVTAGQALNASGYVKMTNQAWTPSAAGTYTVKAKVGTNYATTATIEVVNPATYNLVNGSNLNEMPIGSKDLRFASSNIELIRYNASGKDLTFAPKYVVSVDGKVALDQRVAGLVDDVATSWDETTDVHLTATALGTKTIRVQAYEGAVLVWDQTFTMTITGWDISINTTEMAVNTAKDITVVVKDEKGNLINNATITLTGQTDVTPATNNIQNGTYTFSAVKYPTPGTVVANVYSDAAKTQLKASFNINVLGDDVYSLTTGTPGLLLGKATEVQLVVTENGAAFIPALLEMQVGDAAAAPQNFTPVDTNKDGTYDAIKTTITPTVLKNITLRAKNANGTKRGDLVLEVKAAKLEVIENAKLTRDFTNKITFRIVNPFDGSVIKSNVTLVDNYVATTVTDINGGISGKTLLGAEQYTVNVKAVPSAAAATWTADEAAAKAAEKPIAVTLTVYGQAVDGQFLVEPAKITSNPSEVVIGQANNLTLTYADANGNPIVGKEVYVGTVAAGTLLGKTNDQGQVVYATTGAVSFEAKTEEAARVVAASVAAVVDTVAPVVTAPATVDTQTATITITDNVRVARLMVNGVEINIIPRAEVKHVVNLKNGENVINVIAVDNNYNVVEQAVTINSTSAPVATAAMKLSLGKAGYALNGEQSDNTMVAPFYQSGKFMVPLRALEALGAVCDWDQATETATYTFNGNTVLVKIGSKTATVNGTAVTMDVAAVIKSGRTFVPTRFVAENLGMEVVWVDAAVDYVTITVK